MTIEIKCKAIPLLSYSIVRLGLLYYANLIFFTAMHLRKPKIGALCTPLTAPRAYRKWKVTYRNYQHGITLLLSATRIGYDYALSTMLLSAGIGNSTSPTFVISRIGIRMTDDENYKGISYRRTTVKSLCLVACAMLKYSKGCTHLLFYSTNLSYRNLIRYEGRSWGVLVIRIICLRKGK